MSSTIQEWMSLLFQTMHACSKLSQIINCAYFEIRQQHCLLFDLVHNNYLSFKRVLTFSDKTQTILFESTRATEQVQISYRLYRWDINMTNDLRSHAVQTILNCSHLSSQKTAMTLHSGVDEFVISDYACLLSSSCCHISWWKLRVSFMLFIIWRLCDRGYVTLWNFTHSPVMIVAGYTANSRNKIYLSLLELRWVRWGIWFKSWWVVFISRVTV